MTRRPVEVFAGADADTGEAPADVEITASAAADELQARERPRTGMRVTGPEARTEESTRRQNLPERLEPGVTYRDIRVERRLAGRLPETRGLR